MKKYNVGWGLTNLCNMNCQFCYSKKTRYETEECSLKDWIKFVDENHSMIDSINYGTGENSISDDFFYFVDYVRKNYPSISQSVTTNGYISERVLKDERLLKIFTNSIDEVDVSLDFFDEKRHTEFRGQPNAYKWAINTLKITKKLNKLATIVFVGFEETLKKDNIAGLFEIANKYDTLLRMNIYRPVSKIPEINQKFILSHETLISALDYINDNYEIVALSDALLGSVYAGKTDIQENTGVNSIRILPDGSICPSTYLIDENYRNIYSIKQPNVLDGLEFRSFVNPAIPSDCEGCRYVNTCRGGVLDRRILWYGTMAERDPYCPKRLGKSLPSRWYSVSKTKRVSVHDGYLPTLFFKNK